MTRFLAAVPLALLLSSVPLLSAQVVTSPGVLTTAPGDPTQNDAIVPNTWVREAVRSGSSIGIDGTYARSGNGSLFLSGSSGASKADLEYYFDLQSQPLLSSFQSASYDFYRDGASTVASHLVPVFRLMIYDPQAVGSFGYLVWEPIYDTPSYVAPVDAWQSADLVDGGFWLRQYGKSCFYDGVEGGTNTVADWAAGDTAVCEDNSTSTPFGAGVRVAGVNVGFGSGWSGTFVGAVDNVAFSFENGPSGNFNFETAGETGTVPEPATMTLLATGLAGLASARRRKRSA